MSPLFSLNTYRLEYISYPAGSKSFKQAHDSNREVGKLSKIKMKG